MTNPKSPKGMEFFGYSEGDQYSCGSQTYCLTKGPPDEEFKNHPERFTDPIHVIEKSAYNALLLENGQLKASHERLKDICDRNNFRYEQAYDTLLLENGQLKAEIFTLRSDMAEAHGYIEGQDFEIENLKNALEYISEMRPDMAELTAAYEAKEALAKADELMKGLDEKKES